MCTGNKMDEYLMEGGASHSTHAATNRRLLGCALASFPSSTSVFLNLIALNTSAAAAAAQPNIPQPVASHPCKGVCAVLPCVVVQPVAPIINALLIQLGDLQGSQHTCRQYAVAPGL
jgi:hypothetical protein